MRVYRVSPILEYSPFYKLTYFSKLDLQVGNICEIDLNNRAVLAIVIESLSLNDAKVEIRNGQFKTKKIENKLDDKLNSFLSFEQFLEIQKFADFFLISVGEVVFSLFGDIGAVPLNKGEGTLMSKTGLGGVLHKELKIFPDILSKKTSKNVSIGIGDVGLSGKEVFSYLEILRKNNTLNNLQQITIKDFSLEKYWSYKSPHISQIHLLLLYLKIFNIEVRIFFETHFLGISENLFLESLKKSSFDFNLVESKSSGKKYLYKRVDKEQVLDTEILKKIKLKKTFLFVLTSGYASRIYCKDCGESYKCEQVSNKFGKCESAYKILNDDEGRYLYCKECNFKKHLKDDQYLICKKCGGWGMFPYGEGGQKLYQEILNQGYLKEEILFVDESEKKLSDKKIIEKVNDFHLGKNKEKIILGSKRVLKVLQQLKLEDKQKLQTVVLSLGPLVKGKYFDSDEKFMQLLSEIESVSSEIYIGKNEGDEFLLENFKNKDKYLQQEKTFREKYNLPPFNMVLSFKFKSKDKRNVDKYLSSLSFSELNKGEIYKNGDLVYFWVLSEKQISENKIALESLRNFGQIVIANFVYQNFISKR